MRNNRGKTIFGEISGNNEIANVFLQVRCFWDVVDCLTETWMGGWYDFRIGKGCDDYRS